MRLTDAELKGIIEAFHDHFSKEEQLWLFGSRVDDKQKGGDIDLYIQSQTNDSEKLFQAKINFLVALTTKIGDQKVDVVVSIPPHSLPIHQHAKETGIRLV